MGQLLKEANWGPGVMQLIAPNGYNYVHFVRFEEVDSEDDYKAWEGRGDCYKMHFYDELGGTWSLCFGFHKGEIYAWVEIGPNWEDNPPGYEEQE